MNTNKTISNNNSNSTRPVYVDRNGNVQQPRQQQMQRPAAMKRPAPLSVSASVAERETQERRRIVRSLPPVWAEIAVGSSELPCVMGRTGLLLTQESVGWLNQERRHDIVPVAVVAVAAPVAAPVAEVKPSYSKDSGRTKRKVRVVEVDAPWLDPKEASMAYRESIAWSNKIDAAWTAKKKAMVKAKMVRSMADPTPEAFMSGLGLTFEAEHELLRRRHVAEDNGDFLILSREAMKDPTSPWRVRIDLGSLVAAAAREAQEEVSALERAARVRRELIRSEAQVAAELRAEAQAIVDAELAHEAREAAMLADAEDRAIFAAISGANTAKAQQAIYERIMAQWKFGRAKLRVAARVAAKAEASAVSKPDLVEEARADRAAYPSYAAFRASRISGSRDSKPVHKGQAKVVSKRDVGVVVDPYMVVAHAEAIMEKRQVADLIGPKVVARRVR